MTLKGTEPAFVVVCKEILRLNATHRLTLHMKLAFPWYEIIFHWHESSLSKHEIRSSRREISFHKLEIRSSLVS